MYLWMQAGSSWSAGTSQSELCQAERLWLSPPGVHVQLPAWLVDAARDCASATSRLHPQFKNNLLWKCLNYLVLQVQAALKHA